MRNRALLAASAALAVPLLVLALAACASPPPPPATPDGETQTPAPTDAGPDLGLGANDVLGVRATATASNGAVLDVKIVVHVPEPFSADGAADAITTTTRWCIGEVDDQVIADQGYTFVTVDVTATAREGDWPADTPLVIHPLPNPLVTVAADGDLSQVDRLAVLGEGPSPHCAWPVVLDGAGSGRVHVGFPGDLDGDGDHPPLSAWAYLLYGVGEGWGDEGSDPVELTDCTSQLTPTGEGLGAPSDLWQQITEFGFCVEGGSQPT